MLNGVVGESYRFRNPRPATVISEELHVQHAFFLWDEFLI